MEHKNDTILSVETETTLLPFLIDKLKDRNRDNIKSLLRNKQIWIDGRSVSQFNHPLTPGVTLTIRRLRAEDLPSEKFMRIVFEDDHIIIIDKKAGLLSVTDGHEHVTAYGLLSDWVMKDNPLSKVYIVHRLDQYTSGLLMFVKNETIQNMLRNEWKKFITERAYIAVVEGNVKREKGTIKTFLAENKALVMVSVKDSTQGKLAITHYKKLQGNTSYTLMLVNLETGKKNQIRVHMHDIGHPVAGDRKYGANTNPIGRLCLHATILTLKHPVTGEIMHFESPVPSEFMKIFSLPSEIRMEKSSQSAESAKSSKSAKSGKSGKSSKSSKSSRSSKSAKFAKFFKS
jgi:23S rRNA pseudouridine1911/1915/1917 synthase